MALCGVASVPLSVNLRIVARKQDIAYLSKTGVQQPVSAST